MRFSPAILRKHAGAAFAEAVVADGVGVFPAAGTFMAGGLVDLDGEVFVGVALFGVGWCVCDVVEDELADDEEIFWRHIHIAESGFDVLEACAEIEGDFRVEGVTDLFILTSGFEWLHDFVAEAHEGGPFLIQCGVYAGNIKFRPVTKLNRFWLVVHVDVAEHFFCGEGEDWREDDVEGQAHIVENGLAGAAGRIVHFAGIETVFDDAEVDGAEIGVAEVENAAVDDVEVVSVVAVFGALHEINEAAHHPAIEFWQIVVGDAIFAHIKVGDIPEHEAEGVADLAIRVSDLLDDAVADGNVAAIIGACNPQTQDVGTVLLDDVFWIDAVALGLTHLVAFFVNEEAVGQEALVWCLAINGNGGAQRRVEPAAMLVAAFEIKICWPEVFRFCAQHAFMAGAGVKPNVHDVGFFAEMGAAALRAFVAFWQKFVGAHGKPAVGAMFAHVLLHAGDGVVVEDGLAAVFAIEHWDWYTPDALTGDAPVAAIADHIVESFLAPFWREFDVVFDLVEGFFAEAIDGCEPLVGGAEQGWGAAAPAMWILVLEEAEL